MLVRVKEGFVFYLFKPFKDGQMQIGRHNRNFEFETDPLSYQYQQQKQKVDILKISKEEKSLLKQEDKKNGSDITGKIEGIIPEGNSTDNEAIGNGTT